MHTILPKLLKYSRTIDYCIFRIKFSYVFVVFLLIYSDSFSQDLINSRRSSFYSYIYKLSNKEAKKIYKKDLWKVDTSYFHTLVDSIPTDSIYKKDLPKGHYLKVFTKENDLNISMLTVHGFDVKIVNNNTDLNIQIYDSAGNLITDAKVVIGSKRLRYDPKSQSYRERKSNRKGLLKVSHQGFTSYYSIDREYNNSQFKRTSGKILYSVPLKYVWIPVRFVIFIPIDGVRSLVRWSARGSIRHIGNFFNRSYQKIACLFDDYHCDDGYKFTRSHTGFLVLNKPKYQPGDSVKFKAFIVNKKGKPIRGKVQVMLDRYGKKTKLVDLSPYRKGAFEYQFLLHDSLDLLLDTQLELELRKKDNKVYLTEYFRYEDYELSEVNLSIRTSSKDQIKGKDFVLYAEGTDENDLNLLDAKLEIVALSKEPVHFYDTSVFIPDTLYSTSAKLDVKQETEIVIPDSLFPKADFTYDIRVRLSTSDYDVINKSKRVRYFHQKRKVDYRLDIDSLLLDYKINDVETAAIAQIFAKDRFGNQTEIQVSKLPAKIKINPYYAEYLVKVDSLEESISILNESSMIRCYTERTVDSIHVAINNPRNIPFNYFIYKKNKELIRGYGKELEIHRKATSKQNYFVSIQYLWAGKIKDENYKIPLNSKELKIQLDQPPVIYPGQQTEVEITVTDKSGHPVSDVDLTAYSITKKFNANPPEVPDLEKKPNEKEIINNFRFRDTDQDNIDRYLDYDTWRVLAGLDSIEYYKFRYPQHEVYQVSHELKDNITQFAPYVFSDGYLETIQVVYVDYKPVYFKWSNNPQPYSFQLDSGFHKIQLRANRKEVTIDSLYFPHEQKTIISLDLQKNYLRVRKKDRDPELTESEKRKLYKYIFPYQKVFGEKYAYIKQGKNIQLLSGENTYGIYKLAGPVEGRGITFKIVDGYSTFFQHEPMFEYEFEKGLLKMRQFDVKNRYPTRLLGSSQELKLHDEVLTEKKILAQWNENLEQKRYSKATYSNPQKSTKGTGTLTVNYTRKTKDSDKPLNILIFKYDDPDFIRVYPGSSNTFFGLQKGRYKLIYFYTGSRYYSYDSVFVRADGFNYLHIKEAGQKLKDEFSEKANKIIEKTIFRPIKRGSFEEKTELNRIKREHQQQFTFYGAGEIISGYVYEKGSNYPIPGVNVIVKGTSIGTVTDIDGYYSLKVPVGVSSLVFSYIGCVTEEVDIINEDFGTVYLTADITALSEIVVVAYSGQRRSNLTSSIATVSSGAPGSIDFIGQLSGKVAGVTVQPSGGAVIRMRGASTVSFDQTPLYVIDGVIYTGDINELKPEFIDNIEVLKDPNAMAIYGARAANGVVIISTKENTFKVTGQKIETSNDTQALFDSYGSAANSLRNNFSDYGYWQPRLTTNKEGKAIFNVIFPDDVTNWDTYVLAINTKRQSGLHVDEVKSFKPLMAQLALPRFAIYRDSIKAIGKILNYTPDTLNIKSTFELNDDQVNSEEKTCATSVIDTLYVYTQGQDSIKVKYFIETESGYFDGEHRKIPVYPLGMEQKVGSFYALDADSTTQLSFDPNLGEVTLFAQSDILEVLDMEIEHVKAYKYDCNEQLASKLKVLLSQKALYDYQKKQYLGDRQINIIIDKLMKNKTSEELWGWWGDSDYSIWISLHVLEALLEAKKYGYDIKMKEEDIFDFLFWKLSNSSTSIDKIRIMKMLKMTSYEIDYGKIISEIDLNSLQNLNELLEYLELNKQCGIKVCLDTLDHYAEETIVGNLYYSDTTRKHNLLYNDIQNSILAYSILRYDSVKNQDKLERIRNYLLEKRNRGYWSNTYESSKIIETILSDLLKGKSKLQKSQLTISGFLNKTVSEFPFEAKLNGHGKISISKTGDFPIYFTAYQTYWNDDPKIRNEEFEVKSYFETKDSTLLLKAGQEIKMVVDLKVKKDADYVMVEIPIPASCSYVSKHKNRGIEEHREYFKEQTSIFCEHLKAGDYKFEIEILPRYSGKYHLNPAKAELMYFPTFYGNNEIKKVVVK